jgi:hypothetical protein
MLFQALHGTKTKVIDKQWHINIEFSKSIGHVECTNDDSIDESSLIESSLSSASLSSFARHFSNTYAAAILSLHVCVNVGIVAETRSITIANDLSRSQ